MYISTSHNVGDTVYYYDADNDSVDRAKVVQINIRRGFKTDEISYRLRIRGSTELIDCAESTLFSRPESAFYNNPLPVECAPITEETAEVTVPF
jgi:hypothetical protein